MFTIVIVTLLAHVLAVAKCIGFFVTGDCRRDSEKHIIASVTVGSMIFILFQAWLMVAKPESILHSEDVYSLWLAYNFFTSALHMCLAGLLTKQRGERLGHKH